MQDFEEQEHEVAPTKNQIMIKSMTGFGKASGQAGDKNITVEVKSVNSRQLDIKMRMPSVYSAKEMEIRKEAGKMLNRGKVDLSIYFSDGGEQPEIQLNKELAKAYFNEIKSLKDELNISGEEGLLRMIVQMPEVIQSHTEELSEAEWKQTLEIVMNAVHALDAFRQDEGNSLAKDFRERIEGILQNLKEVETYEDDRMATIKSRIAKNLEEMISKEKVDENRFEQELIYYLEKLDITEEKVRLKTHCEYFLETMNLPESSGKKLNFISQEIGREINTIGSKANDANIQKCVVLMKDELEKVKEQLSNVL